MIIAIEETDRWDELPELISDYPSYMEKYRTPPDKVVAYLASELRNIGQKSAGWVLGVERGGCLAGVAALEESAWEGTIYGWPMAKIAILLATGHPQERAQNYAELLGSMLNGAKARGYRHITCRVDTQDTAQTHSLESAGFLLMDTTIEFLWTPSLLTPEPSRRWQVRPHQESDLIPMANLARHSFTVSMKTRYGEDPYLPLEQTKELYAQWFLESCRGRFAHIVLVAELEGKPIGFQTLKIDEGFNQITGLSLATFGIGTVSDEARGLKVFPSILRGIVRWGEGRGVHLCRGRAVVHNVSMLRACLRSGAYIGPSFHTYHKWLG